MRKNFYVVGLGCIFVILICYFVFQISANLVSTADSQQQDEPSHVLVHPNKQKYFFQEQEELIDNVVKQSTQILPIAATVKPVQVVDVEQHYFKSYVQDIFYTAEEKEDFFTQRGMKYLNRMEIEYMPLLDFDIYTLEKFLTDPWGYTQLTELYGNDIAHCNLMQMSIRWVNPAVGYGVFAEQDLSEGGFVGVYGGIVKDRAVVDNKDYAWAYPVQTLQGGNIVLDAREKGNELCLINDGKDPNCIVKYIPGYDGLWYVCYLAGKDIKKGDQLLVSYGPAYWNTRQYKYQELTDI